MTADQTAALQAEPNALYADVIVQRHLAGPFTYRIPPPLRATLRIGHLVLVPFGRSVIQGAVTALSPTPPPTFVGEQLKEIQALVADGGATEISPHLLHLARQVAESYVAPWGQCLRLVLPPRISTQSDTSRFLLTKRGREALAAKIIESSDALDLLRRLRKRPSGIKSATLRQRHALVMSLVAQGWIQETKEAATPRDLVSETRPGQQDRVHSLIATNSTQHISFYPKKWEDRIARALENRQAARLLVQASYRDRLALLRYAMRRTVGLGRTVLVVVGSAERAEAIAAALAQDGTAGTTCLHGGLPDKKKAERWEQIRRQLVQVVVGTRSAVFLPLRSIGLIWIEREEDPALKEPQEPRYHAREVAWLRAQDEQALFVMGSTHLTLEALSAGEQQQNMLAMSSWREGKPRVEVVDLRGQDRRSMLSPLLVEAMREALARQAGVLLFLNRKGYAGALLCRDCGQVPRCHSCEIAFAYYRHKGSLHCSYCGTTNSIPDCCPACAGPRLQLIGEGTERVEEEVARLFPHTKVLRVDGETMRRPKQAAALWNRVRQREYDVLVGTQVLLRDDLVPAVGLVGMVQADTGLSLPDFRAAERTYHLLFDAADLAQPSSAGGRVILQSYLPSHHAIQAVAQHDEMIFTSEELSHRTVLGYPPAVHLIVLHISGAREDMVEKAAMACVARLNPAAVKAAASLGLADHRTEGNQSDGLTILGPIPSPVPRLRGRYRWQVLIKSHSREIALQSVRTLVSALEEAYPSRLVKFDVDVDPVEMW